MKNNLLSLLTLTTMLSLPATNFAQAPSMGTTADFVLFTSTGGLVNTGLSHLTGHVGSNSGSSTGFGNVNGVMHNNNGATGTAAADLNALYLQLNSAIPAFFPAVLLGGSGQTLTPGVYEITANATLTNTLTLNGQNIPGAVFIIQINGTFGSAANAKVLLTNGTEACNVFWKVEGAVSLASGTSMKGTIVAHNAAISLNSGVTLEGRALSTTGAISTNGSKAYTPIGCGSPYPNGPSGPALLSTACFVLFSTNGPVSNSGTTYATGDIGTNVGLTTGYNSLNVTGTIHSIPNGTTSLCATDLGTVYNYLNGLVYDIELLYPPQFGNKLVLTPHTYLLNGATMLTDTLFLNGEGNPNATFVIQVNGSFSTSPVAVVSLMNGTQSKNVYWKVNGAINVATNSTMRGTFIANNGAISLNTGVLLDGRALSTTGALSTSGMTATMPSGCGVAAASPTINLQPLSKTTCTGSTASFSVNASGTALTYQWKKGTTNLVNGGTISGATSAILVINPVSAADVANNYNVVVSGASAPTVTSGLVSLALGSTPVITGVPSNSTTCSGGAVTFVTAVTGSGLIYQWKKGAVNLTNGGNISGANTPSLTINPVYMSDAASNYNLVIMSSCGFSNTTSNVSLIVNTGQAITTQPLDQAVCEGSSVILNVAATGSGLIYQWRKGLTNLSNGGNISGATSASLTISAFTSADASNYNVLIGGTCPFTITSTAVTLTVNVLPGILTAPVNQTVCVDSPAEFKVAAIGTGLFYQWRKGTVNLVNGGNISGVNSPTLIINPMSIADTAANYNVVITGACSPAKTSANTELAACTTTLTGINTARAAKASIATLYPNPFTSDLMIDMKDASAVNNIELKVFSSLGVLVIKQRLTETITTLTTADLAPGVYYYMLSGDNKTIQTGKLIAGK